MRGDTLAKLCVVLVFLAGLVSCGQSVMMALTTR